MAKTIEQYATNVNVALDASNALAAGMGESTVESQHVRAISILTAGRPRRGHERPPRRRRGLGARTREALLEAVRLAVDAITRDDAIAWFAHAGYALPDQGN